MTAPEESPQTFEVHSPPPKRMPSKQSLMTEDQEFSTHLGPRSRAMSRVDGSGPEATTHHPDLDDEVATLSTKLVNALNHQTNLDDTLSSTRQELESSQDRIRELEEQVARQHEMLAGDVWVKRKNVEIEKKELLNRVVEEKRVRGEMEKEKKKIEQELENLTQALFEEANKMVISAKEDAQREQDALQRKNEQLKAQLADSESLLKSSQEQLVQLKLVLEQMTAEHDDHSGTTPSSPGFSKFAPTDEDGNTSEAISQSGITEPCSPTYPTNLTHLLQPVVRMDLSSFDDFMDLVNVSKRAPSRASSGSYSGLSLGLLNSSNAKPAPSNASTTSLSAAGTSIHSLSPQTPNTPASAASTGSSAPLPPLKDSKFYKRVLAEDIEPTLRLDTAPGLSWLARRAVISAMTEGTLVVEPVPSNSPFASISKPQFYPCSLCGDARRDESHLRNHRFRTSEADSAQRYPLCKYCLGRVRSTCDFLGFLRIVKDGFWRADDADSERAAWEESVRLREQMFWSRIGGGVVPVSHPFHGHMESSEGKSPRTSQDIQPETDDRAAEPENKHDSKAQTLPRDTSEVTLTPEPDITNPPQVSVSVEPVSIPEPPVTPIKTPEAFLSRDEELTSSPTDPTSSPRTLEAPSKSDEGAKRLSLSIPGAFQE
ncbi:GDP/GTP exchange factor Sec2p [Apiospora kogelbergensis]|uniref:GDP/GTP exchange factor Sec2p n=1 Tax=Apiospora kogelbergensis TaxID=1337665 RepID=UPI00312FF3CE